MQRSCYLFGQNPPICFTCTLNGYDAATYGEREGRLQVLIFVRDTRRAAFVSTNAAQSPARLHGRINAGYHSR